MENYNKWISEIFRKVKGVEGYDIIKNISEYYAADEPFGVFTEHIGDPKTVIKSYILANYRDACKTCKSIPQQMNKSPSRPKIRRSKTQTDMKTPCAVQVQAAAPLRPHDAIAQTRYDNNQLLPMAAAAFRRISPESKISKLKISKKYTFLSISNLKYFLQLNIFTTHGKRRLRTKLKIKFGSRKC